MSGRVSETGDTDNGNPESKPNPDPDPTQTREVTPQPSDHPEASQIPTEDPEPNTRINPKPRDSPKLNESVNPKPSEEHSSPSKLETSQNPEPSLNPSHNDEPAVENLNPKTSDTPLRNVSVNWESEDYEKNNKITAPTETGNPAQGPTSSTPAPPPANQPVESDLETSSSELARIPLESDTDVIDLEATPTNAAEYQMF